MDPGAERREDAHTPVADLVAEALDDDRAVVGHHARSCALRVEIPQNVHRCGAVQAVLALQSFDQPGRGAACGTRISASWLSIEAHQFSLEIRGQLIGDGANEGTDGAAEFERPARTVAVPERHLARLAGCGHDHDAVMGDLDNPPGGRAQQERLSHARLVHHFLVELADARAVGGEHGVQAPVRNGAGVRDRQAARTLAGPQHSRGSIPHDARPQLAELLGGIAAGKQVEHGREHLFAELLVRRRAAYDGQQVGDRPVVDSDHRDDLLGQHVQRLARVVDRLDLARPHPLRHDGCLDEIAPVAREDLPDARLADLVARTADPLQS